MAKIKLYVKEQVALKKIPFIALLLWLALSAPATGLSVNIHIIYNGYLPIQERDTNNNVLVTYTRGIDLSDSLQVAGGIGGLLARTDANGSTSYHSDGAGNVTALMDSDEDIVARYLYGPSGKLLGQWGSMGVVNEMQFSSMPHDNLSGLSLYPFRAYEPNLQRWLNQDPIQELGGINLYRAMNNNPLSWVDLLGLAGNGLEGADPYTLAPQNGSQVNNVPYMNISFTPNGNGGVTTAISNNDDPEAFFDAGLVAATSLALAADPLQTANVLAALADQAHQRQLENSKKKCPPNNSMPTGIGSMGNYKNLSPNQLKGIDAHQLKSDFVGPQNVSKYNISVDDNGNITLVPRNPGAGPNVETGLQFNELSEMYPME